MEQAIGKAGRAKYGHEHDIRAEIDRKTGEIRLRRLREVVEEIENVEDEDGSDLPVLYPEGVEEQLEDKASDDAELPVSEWPEPVG